MTESYALFVAFVLGIVEGLTEFLPVSSTGHMIIVGHLLGFEGPKAATFEVVIQLGSILAVVVMFWRRLFGLIGIHFGQKPAPGHATLSLVHIILGMLPAVLIGLAIHSWIKAHLFGPETVMYALVAGGILLIIAEKFRPAVTAERGVVLSELRESDGPQKRIADTTNSHLFANQLLGDRSPIGTAESLAGARAGAVLAFHKRWYRPERTVVVIAGDGEPAECLLLYSGQDVITGLPTLRLFGRACCLRQSITC